MKNTNVCPKCGCNEIKEMKGSKTNNGYGGVIVSGLKRAHTSVFICCNCGFIEEWVSSEKDLEIIKEMK